MSGPSKIEVEVLNWAKYNPRKDIKSTSWLRLDNDLFGKPEFFNFTHSEICFFIYILSLASKKMSGKVTVFYDHAIHTGRFTVETIDTSLKKLNEIEVIKTPRNASVTHKSRERNDCDTLRTNERDERNETNVTNVTNERILQARSADHLPAIKKSKTPSKEKSEPTPVTRIREAFLESYRTVFGKDYLGWGAPENGKATQWLKSIPLEKALELCVLYPHWNDPWVTKRGHAFGILVSQYIQLDAWVSRAPQLLEKIAIGRATEKAQMTGIQRLAEMKAYAAMDEKSDHESFGGISQAISSSAEGGILEQPSKGNRHAEDFSGELEEDYASSF